MITRSDITGCHNVCQSIWSYQRMNIICCKICIIMLCELLLVAGPYQLSNRIFYTFNESTLPWTMALRTFSYACLSLPLCPRSALSLLSIEPFHLQVKSVNLFPFSNIFIGTSKETKLTQILHFQIDSLCFPVMPRRINNNLNTIVFDPV